jgi:hypothetical protein
VRGGLKRLAQNVRASDDVIVAFFHSLFDSCYDKIRKYMYVITFTHLLNPTLTVLPVAVRGGEVRSMLCGGGGCRSAAQLSYR